MNRKMNMSEEPVTIVDRDVLKVLSNDTRMDILKMLSEGGRNPSFVAKKLKKSNATIVEHLQTLAKAGLVKKTASPGKKWVFYSLTERGEGIVKSKSRRLVIILTTSLIAMMASVGTFVGHMYTTQTFGARMAADAAIEAPLAEGVIAAQTAQAPVFLYATIVLLTISLAGIGFYFYKKSKIKEVRI